MPSSSSAIVGGGLCDGFVDGTTREHYGRDKAQFCDSRDGNKYVYVDIDEQVWMAENLNYNVTGSKCYSNNEANCTTYGRLYDWSTAMNLPSNCNTSTCSSQVLAKHQGICPSGWHIPNKAEWDALTTAVGGSLTDAKYLKAKSGWNSCGSSGSGSNYLCEDIYGFSALPSGWFDYAADRRFIDIGYTTGWWNSNERNANNAHYRYIHYDHESSDWNQIWVSPKSDLMSVRCLKD